MAPTLVYAHNIMLRKGPDFRIYMAWISGQMVRTKRNVNPSFDDPDSFILQIQKGVIHANIGDICKYLNSTARRTRRSKTSTFSRTGNWSRFAARERRWFRCPSKL